MDFELVPVVANFNQYSVYGLKTVLDNTFMCYQGYDWALEHLKSPLKAVYDDLEVSSERLETCIKAHTAFGERSKDGQQAAVIGEIDVFGIEEVEITIPMTLHYTGTGAVSGYIPPISMKEHKRLPICSVEWQYECTDRPPNRPNHLVTITKLTLESNHFIPVSFQSMDPFLFHKKLVDVAHVSLMRHFARLGEGIKVGSLVVPNDIETAWDVL